MRTLERTTERTQVNSTKYWLQRARDARTAAENAKDGKVRIAMLGFSEGYERMAKRVERLPDQTIS